MSDLIDRESAIVRACAVIKDDGVAYDVLQALKAIPSTQPQRIKGRWTKAYDGYDGHVKCVQCFKTYDWDTQAQYYNFCPNCGADMRGE